MKISYVREMRKNYLVAEGEKEVRGYEARMLAANPIQGLLEMKVRYTDGKSAYYYDITSRQPLGRLLESRPITVGEICGLLRELYGGSPYMVTMILEGDALESNDAYKALLRIIDNAKPAWVEANLVVLTPYLFLDKYSYLGINSTLDRYRPLNLDGSSALPFTRLGGESEQGIT